MTISYQQNLNQLREDFLYVQQKSIHATMIHLAYSLIDLFEDHEKIENSNSYYLSHIDLQFTPRKKVNESSFELCLVYSYNGSPKETISLTEDKTFNESMLFHEKIPSIHYEKLNTLYGEFILPDMSGLNNQVANHIIGNITLDINCSFKNYHEKIDKLIDEKWLVIIEKEKLENRVDEKIGKNVIKQKI
jgi:hypothetical protein